jgi:hypothetical protein
VYAGAILLVYNLIGRCEDLTTAIAVSLVAIVLNGNDKTGSSFLLPAVRARKRIMFREAASGSISRRHHCKERNENKQIQTKSCFHVLPLRPWAKPSSRFNITPVTSGVRN